MNIQHVQNGPTAFWGRKLKWNVQIHSCNTKNGIIHTEKSEHLKPLKVHQIKFLYDTFPNFTFFWWYGGESFNGAPPNVSGKSSYWAEQVKLMCFPYFEFVLFIVIEVLNRSSCLALLKTNFVKKTFTFAFPNI